MPPFNAMNAQVFEGMNRYFKRVELARELDPEAYRINHFSSFTDEQGWRQRKAEEQVIRDHPELAPPKS